MTRTNTTKEPVTPSVYLREEGERVKVVISVLLNLCGKFSTSSMEKKVAMRTTVKGDRNYEFHTPLTKLIILDLIIVED